MPLVVLRIVGSHKDEKIHKVLTLIDSKKWDVVLVGILVDLELYFPVIGKEIS